MSCDARRGNAGFSLRVAGAAPSPSTPSKNPAAIPIGRLMAKKKVNRRAGFATEETPRRCVCNRRKVQGITRHYVIRGGVKIKKPAQHANVAFRCEDQKLDAGSAKCDIRAMPSAEPPSHRTAADAFA